MFSVPVVIKKQGRVGPLGEKRISLINSEGIYTGIYFTKNKEDVWLRISKEQNSIVDRQRGLESR